METHLPNKSHHALWKSHVTLWYEMGYLDCQWTDLVHSIYKLFWSFWKPEQSLSSEYFCIIVLHEQMQSNDSIYCVSSARSETQEIYYIWKVLYSVASPSFRGDI